MGRFPSVLDPLYVLLDGGLRPTSGFGWTTLSPATTSPSNTFAARALPLLSDADAGVDGEPPLTDPVPLVTRPVAPVPLVPGGPPRAPAMPREAELSLNRGICVTLLGG
jgi:hypothetical protein